MEVKFADLIEPIELLSPTGMESELNMVQTSRTITCNLGYVCKEGVWEIPDN
jgi:hypothetical protein